MLSALTYLNIKNRLILLVALSIAGLLALEAQGLYHQKQLLLDLKQIKTRHVVETVHGVLAYFYARVQNGELTEQQAQYQAMQSIRGIRYEENEYFWINDMQGKMIMHPFKPSLEGKDLSGLEDSTGKKFISDMVNIVKKDNAGFVNYLWPKPGNKKEEPVEKISYVKGFQPWNWLIGSGIYIDDIEQDFQKTLMLNIIWVVIVSGLIIIFSLLIVSSINSPLKKLKDLIQQVESAGDLTLRLKNDGHDEIREIADAFNKMLAHYAGAIKNVGDSVIKLKTTAGNIDTVVSDTTTSITSQQNNINEASHSINKITSSVEVVASSVMQSATMSKQANELAGKGSKQVAETVQSIKSLAEKLNATTAISSQLDQDSNNIGGIIDVIKGIAEQTNLLALNAAIEAARAGEQGRGFAVVADEVRSLAQKTQESTSEIESMIENLRSGSERAVTSISESHTQAQKSVELTIETGQTLDKVIDLVSQINGAENQVTQNLTNQQNITTELNQQLDSVLQESSNSYSHVSEITGAMGNLNEVSLHLNKLMSNFRHS